MLTGLLEDRSAMVGVLAQIEASASTCSNSGKCGRDRNRLNQAMTAHQMACKAKTGMTALQGGPP